jgi:hypothetical protein
MLRLSLPIFEEKGQTTKDQIVQSLLKEDGLKLVDIFKRIKRNYNIGIKYQTVRKAVEILIEQGVLSRYELKYSLNPQWLFSLKSFADEGLIKKSKQHSSQFEPKRMHDDFTSFTISSLFELDNFWNDVLLHFAHKTTAGNKFALNIVEQAWWMLINLGRETQLFMKYGELEIDTHFIFLKNSPINKFAKKIYDNLNISSVFVEDTIIEKNIGLTMVGEGLIEVKYPAALMSDINAFLNKHSDEKYDIPELTKLMHAKHDIVMNIYTNKDLVKSVVEKYSQYLKKL